MSHNSFSLLMSDDDDASSVSSKRMNSTNQPDIVTVMDEPMEEESDAQQPTPCASKRTKKKAAKRAKRQKLENMTSATHRLVADECDESGSDASDDDDVDDNESRQTGGESLPSATAVDATSGTGTATKPSDVDLSTADIATCARALKLLETHHQLMDHPSLRPLRVALAPLVTRLGTKWTQLHNKRAIKRSNAVLSAKEQQRIEYEKALDASARNATGMRAQRLKKLETLNTLVDSDSMGEQARTARLMRVPDGVAITDGRSEDVSMKMLTDGTTANGNRLLLTNGSTKDASSSPAAASSASPALPPSTATLVNPIKCYTCKAYFKQLHHFYDSLCPTCAKLNYEKRELSTDMTGKIVLLTGARVKIGYRILVKLLRCNAFVVATTRFPHDLSTRLRLEHDFAQWKDNIHIYGLDFRNLTLLEQFVTKMYEKYTHLDAIINNACQTVRRPPAYYTHLMETERLAFEDLSKEQQKMLHNHHEFSEQASSLSNHGHGPARLQPNQGMTRITSGSNDAGLGDVEIPEAPSAHHMDRSNLFPPPARGPTVHTSTGYVEFQRPRGSTVTIVEEIDGAEEEKMAEEIVAKAAQSKHTASNGPTPMEIETTSVAAAASATVNATSDALPPRHNPTYQRAASEPASSSSSTTNAASSSSSKPPVVPGSKKRSRRGAMRNAAATASTEQSITSLVPSSHGQTAQFTSASALAAESTQLALLESDRLTSEERAQLFPKGERDVNGQQLDLRTKNSWTMRLEDVPIGEAAEVQAINFLAPFLLNSKLKSLMMKGNEAKTIPRFIVNVSAMEGKFYRHKSSNHPHTNAAKAALNMMTRTSAQEYKDSAMIFMTAVDTGWINDENPLPKAAKIAAKHNFQTPLDEIDAAMRVLDPILTPLHQLSQTKTKSLKDMKDKIPYGYFIKDYVKCEW